MANLEQRIQQLEERQALEDVVTAYLIALDNLADVDAVLDCFSKAPIFDMTGINYPRVEGREALREFFTDTFNGMTHHAHYATNFSLDQLEGNEAACRTHVIGLGVTQAGGEIRIYLQYHLKFLRESEEWKISNFRGEAVMPLS